MDQVRHGVRALALALPGAWEDRPFGDRPVVKIGPKIFAFVTEQSPHSVTLKVDPDRGEALRGAYPGVVTSPPYLSKRHWIAVRLDGTVDPDEVEDLLDASYELVLRSLTRSQRDQALTGAGPAEKARAGQAGAGQAGAGQAGAGQAGTDQARADQNRTDANSPTRRKPTRS